ncbi:unnamed protein product [Acanthoscelides obtectus]|uniref:WH1 domain-containing protein n=1 Tax=Acanthoscelides obtectus TaxID=200917 RepID=A0A9P0LH66_ACAOB|nr:unnamed protein product [Acanthoscelides obtectus]CAK1656552.1 FK506-binding protein 15 [Acanthoscelides obtectus]
MKNMYDSDDYDFTPSNSSKLASLFNNSIISNDSNSLTYTAPKQPKSSTSSNSTPNVKEEGSKSKVQTAAVVAKIVTLWKLENKEYKCLGKHGLAIIGSTELDLYELIVYKEKTDVLIRTKLNEAFSFYKQQNNFASFYDSNSQNWLVKFDNNDRKQFTDILAQYGAKVIEKAVESNKVQIQNDIKPDLLPKPEVCNLVSKTAEDQLSDSSESVKRANILNRIAKMGQQVISNPLGHSSELSESEPEEPESDQKIPPPRKQKRVPHSALSPLHVNRQVVVEPQYMPQQNYYPNDGLNHFLIAQNTELKMHLANISAKIDNLSIGSNQSNYKNSEEDSLKSKIRTLELVNENLKTAWERSEKKCELFQRTSQDNKDSIKKVEELEENIKRLSLELENAKKHELTVIEDLQNEITTQEDIINNQKARIQDLEDTCEKFLQKQTNTEELEATISSLKKEIELQKEKTNVNVSKSNMDEVKLANMVKQHMNNMFQSLINNFQEDTMYYSSDIQTKIAKELKKATFKIIDDYKHFVDNEGE